MKKLLLTLVACVVAIAANAMTVYFQNTSNWQTVTVHYWGGSDPTSWPGTNVTANKITATNGTSYYWAEIPDNSTGVIFNNNGGGQQTVDLNNPVNGNVYSQSANGKGVSGSNMYAIGTITKQANGDYIFTKAGEVVLTPGYYYFPVATFNNSSAYFYTWEPYVTDNWPGTQLTKQTINGTEYWVFKGNDENVMTATFAGIQLNSGGDANKTEYFNISLKPGDIIDIKSGVLGNDPYTTTPEIPDIPTGVTLYIVGSSINGAEMWGASNSNEMTYNETDDVYTWEGTSLSGKIKFNDGSWDNGYNIGEGMNGASLVAGQKYTTYNGDSADIPLAAEITNPKVVLSLTENYVIITGDSDVPTPETGLYLIGNFNNWNLPGKAFDDDGDGLYSLTEVTLSGEGGATAYFALTTTNSTDWDAPETGVNANRYGPQSDATAIEGENTFVKANTSWNIPAGIYNLSVNMEDMVLDIELVESLEPAEPVVPDNFYVRGDIFNDWGAGVKMDKVSDEANTNGEYTYTVTLDNIAKGFKFTQNADNWDGVSVGPRYGEDPKDKLEPGVTAEAWIGVSANFYTTDYENGYNNVILTLYYNPDQTKSSWVKLESASSDESDEFYLVGTMSDEGGEDWAFLPSFKFEYDEANGEYTLNLAAINTADKFQIATEGWGKQYTFTDEPLAPGGVYTLVQGYSGGDMWVSSTILNATLVLTIDGSGVGTLKVTGESVPADNVALTVGNDKTSQSGDVDNEGNTINLTVEEGEESAVVYAYAPENAQVYYAVVKGGNAVKAMAAPAGTEFTAAAKADQEWYPGAYEIELPVGQSTLYLYYEGQNESDAVAYAATVTNGTPLGVDSVEAAAGEAVYYNLQGQKVANPDKGIYIKVAGGKASKVIL